MLQVVPRSRGLVDGIAQHAARLSTALEVAGHDCTTIAPDEIPSRGSWDVAHLHYMPFSFGAYGLGAVGVATRLRRLAPVVLTVHEGRIDYALSARGTMLAAAQDGMLQLLVRLAAIVIITTGRWRRLLRGVPARVVPSGSVLPIDEEPRLTQSRLSVRVGIIPSTHAGRMQHLSEKAARHLRQGRLAEVVAVGAGAAGGVGDGTYLEPRAFAAALSQCDLLLLPFLDGVTGRRTSFMSALQLAIPTLTTLVDPMDDFTVDGAFEHTDPFDGEGFITLADHLATDAPRRAELARRGRDLFTSELSWAHLAGSIEAAYLEALA